MREETPTPERVTLTDKERDTLTSLALRYPQFYGEIAPAFRVLLAAREQALREEIAGEIEAYARSHKVTSDWGNLYNDGVMHGLNTAAHLARGGAR